MDYVFINDKLEKPTAVDLTQRIARGLLNADMQAAIAAGCRFEVTMRKEGNNVVFKMQTKERVSILKHPSGRTLSVLVERV